MLRDLAARTDFTPPANWARVYAKIAIGVHCPSDFIEAAAFAAGFVEPALRSDADGMTWSPSDAAWSAAT